jgi:ABC-type phosphate transport system ATPase subunit
MCFLIIGMDPVNKHKVWNAIANLKRNKVIVLTTHSMEEADFLGTYTTLYYTTLRYRAAGSLLHIYISLIG